VPPPNLKLWTAIHTSRLSLLPGNPTPAASPAPAPLARPADLRHVLLPRPPRRHVQRGRDHVPHAARYSEQTRRATERHGGRPPAGARSGTGHAHGADSQSQAAVPGAHAGGGGGCLIGAPRFCSREVASLAGSRLAGGWPCRRMLPTARIHPIRTGAK